MPAPDPSPNPGAPAPERLGSLRGARLAFAGGGTGGHVVPGMHLLEHMAESGAAPADVLWFGAGRSIEQRVLKGLEERMPGVPLAHRVLELEARNGGAPGLLRLLGRTLPATLRARRELRARRSQLLLGLGGYTTLPAVFAARSLGLPVALLEINAVRGKATRWLSPFAERIFHAWPSTLPGAKQGRDFLVGAPLAQAFAGPLPDEKAQAAARQKLGFEGAAPLLVVLGGSQGAASLNRFLEAYLEVLRAQGIQVLHQVGPGRLAEAAPAAPGYQAHEYLDDVPCALAAASVVLCRGGASTLAEIAARACPSVVVPYPHHADSHQERNARLLGEGVRVVADEDLGERFLGELIELLGPNGNAQRQAMAEVLKLALARDASAQICMHLASLLH